MKFTTEKIEKRLNRTRIISIILIFIGVIQILLKDYSSINNFAKIGSLFDGIIPLALGIFLVYTSSKKLKEVSGSYIQFDNTKISFKSRKVEKTFKIPEDINGGEITLKYLLLEDNQGIKYKISMDDYLNFKDKKEIKKHFGDLIKK